MSLRLEEEPHEGHEGVNGRLQKLPEGSLTALFGLVAKSRKGPGVGLG